MRIRTHSLWAVCSVLYLGQLIANLLPSAFCVCGNEMRIWQKYVRISICGMYLSICV